MYRWISKSWRANQAAICFAFASTLVLHTTAFSDETSSPTSEPAESSLQLDGFDEFVDQVLSDWQVPGVAIAIVKNDRAVLTKGYGFRYLEERLPVTANTLFPIASITKPFTASAAALLADEGKLRWDDRVREHLRAFKLYDERAAAELTIRDCLSHRTGLSMAGLRWYGINGWPEQQVTPTWLYRTLRYMEPTHQGGTLYQYSNSGYFIGGELVAKVSGSPWDQFVQERLLSPLGMSNTNFSSKETQQSPDFARPYGLLDGEVMERPFFESGVVGPVGAIHSTATDMIQFLRFNLGQGTLDGKQIVSKKRMKDLLTPEVVMPEFNSYGRTIGFHSMGWQVLMIECEKWARHTGSIPGFTSVMAFCPNRKCGYVVLTNLAFRPTAELIEANIRSRLLGQGPKDMNDLMRRIESEDRASGEAARQQRRPVRVKGTSPSRNLDDYAGTYSNPAYGGFSVAVEDDRLSWAHHGFIGSLEHFHYDMFVIIGNPEVNGIADKDLPQELVTFHRDIEGKYGSLSMPRPPMPNDILFERQD